MKSSPLHIKPGVFIWMEMPCVITYVGSDKRTDRPPTRPNPNQPPLPARGVRWSVA